MRIRKHAKLAGLSLISAASGGSSADPSPHSLRFYSPHMCQLNQSPWDVISFPPDSASSPFQVDGEDSDFTTNVSLGDSPGAVESVASMRISVDVDDKNVNSRGTELGFGNGGTILCCKTDGKSWQCKKESSRGHSFCQHHFAQLKLYNGPAHPSSAAVGTKSEKPAPIRRRGRPRKTPPAAENPHEFYYYSGFGPRWGKKRGVSREAKSKNSTGELLVKEIIPPSLSSSSSRIESDGFDYVDDDDDEDEEEENVKESGGFGKRRGRKRIKARSLKSLM